MTAPEAGEQPERFELPHGLVATYVRKLPPAPPLPAQAAHNPDDPPPWMGPGFWDDIKEKP